MRHTLAVLVGLSIAASSGCTREVTLAEPLEVRFSGAQEWMTLPAGTRVTLGGFLQPPRVVVDAMGERQKEAERGR